MGILSIDQKVIFNHQNVDLSFSLVNQKKRIIGSEKNKAAKEEVDKLLTIGFILEVNYPRLTGKHDTNEEAQWQMDDLCGLDRP